MFLKKLRECNPALLDASLYLHRNQFIEPDSFVIDYQAVMDNVSAMVDEARKHDIQLYAMTKQFGRIPQLAKDIIGAGFAGVACVDYREASAMIDQGVKIGNVGHLVQPPLCLLEKIIAAKPDVITVYTLEKASQINQAAKKLGLRQPIMLKVYQHGDLLYPQQEAGFHLDDLPNVVPELLKLNNVKIDGLTHFPCLLLNNTSQEIAATPNAYTVLKAKQILLEMGIPVNQINLPSSTCCAAIGLIKSLGGTHGEPGHGITGTTMYHAIHTAREKIASLYVSEISHQFNGKSYCFAGGHYRRSQMQSALVGGKIVSVNMPADDAIDYHFEIPELLPVGESVVMSFRTQVFVTRSQVVLLDGVQTGSPKIMGIYDSQGRQL